MIVEGGRMISFVFIERESQQKKMGGRKGVGEKGSKGLILHGKGNGSNYNMQGTTTIDCLLSSSFSNLLQNLLIS